MDKTSVFGTDIIGSSPIEHKFKTQVLKPGNFKTGI